jgi:hypothetical protein
LTLRYADPNSLQEVRQLSEQKAQFIVDHYDLLEMMISLPIGLLSVILS